MDAINFFVANPFPDGSRVFVAYWQNGPPMSPTLWLQMPFHQMTVRDCIKTLGPIPKREWFHIMLGIAARLKDVHEAGRVHGDLKPSNGRH